MSVDKRQFQRVTMGVSGKIYIAKSSSVPCEILDISLGGAFIHCTAPIQIGQEIMVEIHFEDKAQLTAKVVRETDLEKLSKQPEKSVVRWVRGSSQSGFGVEFVHLSGDKREYLEKLIQHLDAEQSSS